MSPFQARKACPHVGHMWVGADVAVEVVLALRMSYLVCGSLMRLASAAQAPDDSLPLHAASVSHVLWSMPRLLRDALRQSLKRFFCPLHSIASLSSYLILVLQ